MEFILQCLDSSHGGVSYLPTCWALSKARVVRIMGNLKHTVVSTFSVNLVQVGRPRSLHRCCLEYEAPGSILWPVVCSYGKG